VCVARGGGRGGEAEGQRRVASGAAHGRVSASAAKESARALPSLPPSSSHAASLLPPPRPAAEKSRFSTVTLALLSGLRHLPDTLDPAAGGERDGARSKEQAARSEQQGASSKERAARSESIWCRRLLSIGGCDRSSGLLFNARLSANLELQTEHLFITSFTSVPSDFCGARKPCATLFHRHFISSPMIVARGRRKTRLRIGIL
jgi:hypothetical protein